MSRQSRRRRRRRFTIARRQQRTNAAAEQIRAAFDKRTQKETKTRSALAANLILVRELSRPRQKELAAELAALFAEVRWNGGAGADNTRCVAPDPRRRAGHPWRE